MLAVNESARPPYVIFEERYAEDREASMAKGKLVTKPVDWVIIRQAGNKDSSESEALSWLDRISQNPGYQKDWVEGFRRAYKEWKSGQQPVPSGTGIRNWPAISPAQAAMLQAIAVLTVEDLAAANESTLQRMGIGARELKMKAQAWLDSAQKIGSTAEELAAGRARITALEEQNALLRQMVAALKPEALPPAVPTNMDTDPFG